MKRVVVTNDVDTHLLNDTKDPKNLASENPPPPQTPTHPSHLHLPSNPDSSANPQKDRQEQRGGQNVPLSFPCYAQKNTAGA